MAVADTADSLSKREGRLGALAGLLWPPCIVLVPCSAPRVTWIASREDPTDRRGQRNQRSYPNDESGGNDQPAVGQRVGLGRRNDSVRYILASGDELPSYEYHRSQGHQNH